MAKILQALIIFYKMNTDNDALLKFWFHRVIFKSQNRFKDEKIFHLREDCNFGPVLWLNHKWNRNLSKCVIISIHFVKNNERQKYFNQFSKKIFDTYPIHTTSKFFLLIFSKINNARLLRGSLGMICLLNRFQQQMVHLSIITEIPRWLSIIIFLASWGCGC